MNLVPVAKPQLDRLVALWTCGHCAGVGQLTTSRTSVFLGVMSRETITRRCEPCHGSGIEANAAERLGLLDA